jgi:hypothetical protein
VACGPASEKLAISDLQNRKQLIAYFAGVAMHGARKKSSQVSSH